MAYPAGDSDLISLAADKGNGGYALRQTTTAAIASPATTLDPEVVEFRSQFDKTSPLGELVRTGAQRLLAAGFLLFLL